MANFARNWLVDLSNTAVFPAGTHLRISRQGSDYLIDVVDAGPCAPTTDPLTATDQDGMLVSQEFESGCETSGTQYTATFVVIGPRRLAGQVDYATAPRVMNGNPTGTWTAEEEGGDAEV
jgi:hypothetical protein